jgi:hypothetical protein
MASKIYLIQAPTGMALTGDLFTETSDTAVVTGLTFAEAANAKGWYTVTDATAVSSVKHRLVIKEGGVAIGSFCCYLTDTANTFHFTDFPGQLNTSGHISANVAQFGGVNGTFSSGRPEVNATHWGGTAVGSATVRANLISIMGSALSGTAAQIAAAFSSFFNVSSPTGTVNSLPAATPGNNGGLLRAGSNASTTFAGMFLGDVSLDTLEVTEDVVISGGLSVIANFVPWNAAWDAEVQSEVADALEAIHLDHLLAATYDPSSKPGASDALLNELVENDGGVARFTANALEEAPTGGSAPTAEEIADEVETRFPANFADLAITADDGYVTVGTNTDKTGYALTQSFPANFADLAITASTGRVTVGTNADKTGYSLTQSFPTNFASLAIDSSGQVTVGAFASALDLTATMKASVNTEADTALADYDPPTKAELDAGFAALNDFDPANDTVAHVTLVDTCTTNTDMRGTDDAALASVCTEQRLAELDSEGLPADVAALKVDTESILEDTGTDIPSAISNLNDLSSGDVETAVGAGLATYGAATAADVSTAESNIRGADSDTLETLSDQLDGVSTLDASGIRDAIGLASANLDDQLHEIPTVTLFEDRTLLAAEYATASAVSSVQDDTTAIVNAIDGMIADEGTAQAGDTASITLRSGASAEDDYYKDAVVNITTGTGAGQARQITGYTGATKVATVDEAWVTTPDNTSEYQVIGRVV